MINCSYKILTKLLLSTLLLSLFVGCSSRYEMGATQNTSKARQKATMRSYKVKGKRYHPSYAEVGQMSYGVGSWYGADFHGGRTSNGERYNMHKRTGAHKTLPMDTMVKVTNLTNNKSTVIRINDRGPFVRGRIVDCSYKAGKDLGLDKSGIAKVSVEVLGFAGKIEPYYRIVREKKVHIPTRIKLSNFGVQVGAFKRVQGANSYKTKYSFANRQTIVKKFYERDNSVIYRVWVMGFGTQEEAEEFRRANRLYSAFIVRN
ncbi:MAG: septal ring lytic transglycosylase RlpA family protein [Sulfurovum sp.]